MVRDACASGTLWVKARFSDPASSVNACGHNNVFVNACGHNNVFVNACGHNNVFVNACGHNNVFVKPTTIRKFQWMAASILLLWLSYLSHC